ncbi:group II decarboxylase [Aspergillus niger]|uniref:Group II decarboxylase n=1 Tax=Aspergillus niger TaxID=5061 RepID=A0A100IRY2_ASPNG|nr:group II decarboxylase [Aspergillus niger]
MAEMNQHSENSRALILDIVTKHAEGRRSLDNTDASFITREMIEHPIARQSITTLGDKLTEVMGNLANSSIPFWSTRYNAHMNMDTTMASTLGYIAAMMYNPNNVTPESSPYTTHIEHKVGNQLCKMLGYNVDCGDPEKAIGWGHITCDGSVANLEAIWAARNLKFYPLSLKLAMDAGNPLHFLTTAHPPMGSFEPPTVAQLRSLGSADSITIDPHKSGYIHYPAGGLCYRDERTRYLITWTSPIIHHNGDENDSMGIYGVEGSKPGAAPVAVWLSHETIGLNRAGYGLLLGKALFASVKLYCHIATMTIGDDGEGDDDLIVVPFNMLPAEQNGTVPWSSRPVLEQRNWIRNHIINPPNSDLESDPDTFNRFKEIGSDLMINSFTFNFRINGVPNKDVIPRRYRDNERPLILTETEMSPNTYGDSLETYKERLGLGKEAVGDLKSLVSVTMSPWPSDPDILKSMADGLKSMAKEEIERCRKRNTPTPDHHGFIMQGDITLFLVHFPMFNMANHRRQLILEASIPDQVMKEYRKLRAAYPDSVFTLGNIERHHLNDLLQAEQFTARMDRGIPKLQPPVNDPTGEPVMPDPLTPPFTVHITRKVVDRSLVFDNLENEYPELMPFYLYGCGKEHHMDHRLTKSPNAQLTAELAMGDPSLSDEQLQKGVRINLTTVFERAVQPLPTAEGQIVANTPGLNFQPGTRYPFEAYADGQRVAGGMLTLGARLYADWHEINMDGADEH